MFYVERGLLLCLVIMYIVVGFTLVSLSIKWCMRENAGGSQKPDFFLLGKEYTTGFCSFLQNTQLYFIYFFACFYNY